MNKYKELNLIAKSFFNGIKEEITILSNATALINDYIDDISWVGFYLNKNNKLILGPFQGKVACMEIDFSKGVCGACARTQEVQLVPNVHEFEGHIACDSRTNSEIVLPIIIDGNFYGELDIDSMSFNRFNEEDKLGLEEFITSLIKALKSAR
ncbi:MAG: GAF domain-containing protein [Acholeplasmatales bacterium]|nr:GAF domain-containing protein [Acholeplasmatales bacterium]